MSLSWEGRSMYQNGSTFIIISFISRLPFNHLPSLTSCPKGKTEFLDILLKKKKKKPQKLESPQVHFIGQHSQCVLEGYSYVKQLQIKTKPGTLCRGEGKEIDGKKWWRWLEVQGEGFVRIYKLSTNKHNFLNLLLALGTVSVVLWKLPIWTPQKIWWIKWKVK